MTRFSLLLIASACALCNAFMVPAAKLASPTSAAVTPLTAAVAPARFASPLMGARGAPKKAVRKPVKKAVKKPVKKAVKKPVKKVVRKKAPAGRGGLKSTAVRGGGKGEVNKVASFAVDAFGGYGGGNGAAVAGNPLIVGGAIA